MGPGGHGHRAVLLGGYLDCRDEIGIQSASLSAGTPVDITFAFYAANETLLAHTAFGESHYGSGNGAGVDYQVSDSLTAPGLDSITISNAENRFQQDDDLFVPRTTTGSMDPATPLLEVVFAGEVGATVSLQFRAFARIGVTEWSSGVGQVDVHDGQAIGAIAAPEPQAVGPFAIVTLGLVWARRRATRR